MFHTCLRSIFNNFPLNTYVMSRVLPEMLFAWVPSSQTTLQWERILLNWKITIRFQFQFNDISDGNFGTIDLIWCISLGILNTEDKSWSLSFFRIKMFQCFPTEIIFLNFVDKVILLEKLNNWLSNKQNSILPVHTTLTLQSSIIILQQSVNFLLETILTTNNFEYYQTHPQQLPGPEHLVLSPGLARIKWSCGGSWDRDIWQNKIYSDNLLNLLNSYWRLRQERGIQQGEQLEEEQEPEGRAHPHPPSHWEDRQPRDSSNSRGCLLIPEQTENK